jgi:hypothetical protein
LQHSDRMKVITVEDSMKNQSHLIVTALLALLGTCMPMQATETKSTWQKWKKPVIATTMIIGSIAAWLLLDYYLNGRFNSQLDRTTKALVEGCKGNSFFESNGRLRKHPFISDAEFKDYQLYENARFGNMYTPLSQSTHTLQYCFDSFRYGFSNGLSSLYQGIRYSTDSFNVQLLLNQVGSKICFLTALIGGYWLAQTDKKVVTEDTTNSTVAQS